MEYRELIPSWTGSKKAETVQNLAKLLLSFSQRKHFNSQHVYYFKLRCAKYISFSSGMMAQHLIWLCDQVGMKPPHWNFCFELSQIQDSWHRLGGSIQRQMCLCVNKSPQELVPRYVSTLSVFLPYLSLAARYSFLWNKKTYMSMKSCVSFQIYEVVKFSHLPSTYSTLQEMLLWRQALECDLK